MDIKSTEKEGYLKIFRGKGFGRSISWDGSDTELPDNGAEVVFVESIFKDYVLNIHFGYDSPSGKEYKRNINIDIFKVIQLRDFLNKCINKQAIKDK